MNRRINGRVAVFRLAVYLQPSEEMEALRARVEALEKECDSLRQQLSRMSIYAELSLRMTDELRQAKSLLELQGVSTDFITTLR